MIRRLLLALFAALLPAPALAAEAVPLEEIRLWPGTPPGNGKVEGPEKIGGEGTGLGAVSNVAVPRMRVYRPVTPNGAAVLVAGGGGYFRIQLKKESTPAAEWLAARGFTVFELIYRLPNDGWDAAALAGTPLPLPAEDIERHERSGPVSETIAKTLEKAP